jgi:hypothetical protein
VEDVDEELVNPTDKRIFAISTAFHRGYSVEKIWQMTNIDRWFLNKLYNIFKIEKRLMHVPFIFSPAFFCIDFGSGPVMHPVFPQTSFVRPNSVDFPTVRQPRALGQPNSLFEDTALKRVSPLSSSKLTQ